MLLLSLPLIEAVGNMLVANIASASKSIGWQREKSRSELLKGFSLVPQRTFLLHLGFSISSVVLLIHSKWRKERQLFSTPEKDPLNTSLKPSNFGSKDAEMQKEDGGTSLHMTVSASKLLSVSVASIIVFAIFGHSQESVLAAELTYR